MAKLAAKNSSIFVNANSQTLELRNVQDWSVETSRNTIDVSTIGTEWKEFLSGQITGTGSFNTIFDPADTGAAQAIEDAMWEGEEVFFYVRPEGSGLENVQYAYSAMITNWNLSAGTEDAIKVAISFQITGEIMKGTEMNFLTNAAIKNALSIANGQESSRQYISGLQGQIDGLTG